MSETQETWHKDRLRNVLGKYAIGNTGDWWAVQDSGGILKATCVFESNADRIIADHNAASQLAAARKANEALVAALEARAAWYHSVDGKGKVLDWNDLAECNSPNCIADYAALAAARNEQAGATEQA